MTSTQNLPPGYRLLDHLKQGSNYRYAPEPDHGVRIVTPTQVEAVARALHAAVPHMAWETLKPWEQAEYRRKARVAIEACQTKEREHER